MPLSPVVRRMGEGWNRLMKRVSAGVGSIPDEGLTRSAFADGFLAEVDPIDVDEVLKLLHNRRLVFVSRSRGNVRVYREQPEREAGGTGVTRSPCGLFLSAVAPHFLGFAAAERNRAEARKRDDWSAHGEADDTIKAHVYRIVGVCRGHIGKGLSLAEVREALHETFAAEALRALVYYEPRLQKTSAAQSLEDPTRPRKPRLPNGLTIEEKVFRIIEREGRLGITKSDIQGSIIPRLPMAEVEAIADGLVAAGFVVSGTMRLRPDWRPGVRYFEATHGLPHVAPDGVAVFLDA